MKRKRSLLRGLGLLVVAGTVLGAATPTPTPRPKLSGGFGRPRATPVAAPVAEGGQSLADVVRAAQDARGVPASGEKSGVMIDNRTLVKDADKGRITTSAVVAPKPAVAAPTPAASSTAAAATNGANGAAPEAGAPGAGGEAEWRETARRDRKRVEDAKTRMAELQATTKKLESDFYAWDDGQYRDRVIKPAWDRARAELEEARLELDAAEKYLADLPERARKAGALPGWIRE